MNERLFFERNSLYFCGIRKKAMNEVYLRELMSYVDEESMRRVSEATNRDVRIGLIQDIMRNSVGRSSVGYYNGELYYFGGEKYERLERDSFGDIMYEFGKRLGVVYSEYGKLERAIKVCQRKLWTKHLKLNKECVIFRNCVLDLRSGRAEAFSRDYVQMTSLPYDYDALARGYLWESFLNQVLPHKVYQKILQEFLGSLFISRRRAKMETLMILRGDGSNGKGVVFETIVGVLGKENVSTFGLDELISGGSERKRNLATINGKRLNFCSDSKHYVIDGDSGILKALVSGEPMEARPMYGSNFTADELPQLMIAANKLPTIKDWGFGMKRRLCILPFDVEIPKHKQNKSLADEMRSEYSYIFNWIMEGRERFISQGYKLSESELQAELLSEYEAECNVAVKFMHANGYLSKFEVLADAMPYWIPMKRLYSEYVRWADCYCEEIVTIRKFGMLLNQSGFKRRRVGTGTEYAIYGKKALALMRKVFKDMDIDARRSRLKLNPYSAGGLSAEHRKEIEREIGSVIAYGDSELASYLSVTETSVRGWLKRGRLEGCYKMYNGQHVYSLDMIDRVFVPDWRGSAVERLEKQADARRLKAAEKDYDFHNLV